MMKKIIFPVICAFFSTSALADIFAWTDEKGIRRSGEAVPKQYLGTARNLTAEATKEPTGVAADLAKEKLYFKQSQEENRLKSLRREEEEKHIEEKKSQAILDDKTDEAIETARKERQLRIRRGARE